MSLLNCFCTSRTRVESLRPEKQSDTSIHQYLVDEPTLSWVPASTEAREVISSTNVSHYELQVEIGRGFDNLTSIHLARHTPTGTLVTIKITNLEDCTEERLKALQEYGLLESEFTAYFEALFSSRLLDKCSNLLKSVILSHFFRHPNITTYWTVFTVGSWLWVISPFMAYGSASQLLKTYFPEGMSETLVRNILFGAVRGLNYLHQNGCIHRKILIVFGTAGTVLGTGEVPGLMEHTLDLMRDAVTYSVFRFSVSDEIKLFTNLFNKRSLKASHILISGDGLVTLSGLSHLHSLVKHGQRHRAVYDFPQFSTSVQPWLSPELLRQDLHGYNVKSDIYSVGITACELASGQVPFQDMHRTQMLLQKLKGPPYSPLDINVFPQSESRMKNSRSGIDSGIGESVLVSSGTHTVNSERLQTPSTKTFSPAFFSLVQLCLQQDPEKRPSASSLLSHVFFKQMKEQSQNSILSLLPPAYNKPSVAVPPVLPWTEPECVFPEEKDSYWEF